jgi:2-C-methyl-D-erythritol 4-phosphate cytidylyltransferase
MGGRRGAHVYQLIAIDVDGTLLTSSHELRPRVRQAVRAARARGIHIALATGKLLRSVADLVTALDLDGPQITCNGTVIVDARGGTPLAFWPLAPNAWARTLDALRAADPTIAVAWYTPDAIYTDAAPGPLDTVLAAYHEPPLLHVASLDDTLPTPAKLLVTGSPERLAALRAAVAPRLEGVVRVVSTTPDFLEFFHLQASKGVGLRAVIERLGLTREQVLALGDGENDIPLLAAAGRGVAVANAVPALLAHAQGHTASNDADGVALVIEDLLAGNPPGVPSQGRTVAVILCAGQGTRMGAAGNKVFLPLGGKPLLAHAIAAFERAPTVDEILLVAHPREVEQCRALAARYHPRKVIGVVAGGASRHQSEQCALDALRERIDAGAVGMILIHDGARPFVTPDTIARLIRAAREVGGALLATPLAPDEVVAQVSDQGEVTTIFPTREVWRAQTPQAFAASILLEAYDSAASEGYEGTDTASVVERVGQPVQVVPGSPRNIKITTPGDLARAAMMLRRSR